MRISWDTGERAFTQGVSNGVFYGKNSPGVPWNGLLSVTEKGDGSVTSLYIDGRRYVNRVAPTTFAGTISAFTYPDEFEPYNGLVSGVTGQPRSTFGLTWRTNREIHVIYNALAGPSSDQYSTLGENADPVAFQWDFTTLPVKIPGGKPSAHLTIMLDYAHAPAIAALEDILYGDDANDPSLPTPDALFSLFDMFAVLQIVDNGDGTWTATGPDEIITMLDASTFQIDSAAAIYLNDTTYTIHSL